MFGLRKWNQVYFVFTFVLLIIVDYGSTSASLAVLQWELDVKAFYPF